jgi:hypothetical protein
MTTTLKRAALAAVICVTTACGEIPLLPQWDANWNVPLPSQSLTVPAGTIPAGFPPQNVSFPTQQQPLDKSVGSLLKDAADTGQVQMTLDKQASLALNGAMTLQIDSTSAFGPATISLPFAIAATETIKVTTSATNLAMIRATANAGRSLYIRLSGTVSNPGPGSVVVTAANGTINIRLALLATIHVSR